MSTEEPCRRVLARPYRAGNRAEKENRPIPVGPDSTHLCVRTDPVRTCSTYRWGGSAAVRSAAAAATSGTSVFRRFHWWFIHFTIRTAAEENKRKRWRRRRKNETRTTQYDRARTRHVIHWRTLLPNTTDTDGYWRSSGARDRRVNIIIAAGNDDARIGFQLLLVATHVRPSRGTEVIAVIAPAAAATTGSLRVE